MGSFCFQPSHLLFAKRLMTGHCKAEVTKKIEVGREFRESTRRRSRSLLPALCTRLQFLSCSSLAGGRNCTETGLVLMKFTVPDTFPLPLVPGRQWFRFRRNVGSSRLKFVIPISAAISLDFIRIFTVETGRPASRRAIIHLQRSSSLGHDGSFPRLAVRHPGEIQEPRLGSQPLPRSIAGECYEALPTGARTIAARALTLRSIPQRLTLVEVGSPILAPESLPDDGLVPQRVFGVPSQCASARVRHPSWISRQCVCTWLALVY